MSTEVAKPRLRVPVSMSQGIPQTLKMYDGLANIMSGSGTTVDKRTQFQWLQNILAEIEIENAYRGSWLMRKIVDLPAEDMTREWRDWQADDTQIEKLEEYEKKLKLQEKIMQAIILGRLGGGALIMGFGDDPEAELNPETVKTDGLRYLYVAHKSVLKPGPVINDPEDDNFGEPETFQLSLSNGKPPIIVHHSRVIVFKGLYTGNMSAMSRKDYWGDSIVSACLETVNNATSVPNEFSTLIGQAKIDVFKIPDFMAKVGNAAYEAQFLRRVELSNLGKSNHRALMMDAAEDWEQRQLTLVGMADLIRVYVALVAGAADIPATRLLGKSPDGMNSTGDSDQSNYEQMIRTKQKNVVRPALEKLDQPLIRSALGSKPDEVYWEFAPLSVLSESDQANVENKEADTLSKLTATGLFQDEALEEAFSNRMVESGRWPGYDKAREDALKAAENDPTPEDITGVTVPGPPVQPLPGQPPIPAAPQPAPRTTG
jgi:phage-related protein (TIGR01555 family)